MHDLRRISLMAVILLVALRMSIGWQFLYEGYWKLDTQSSAKPWTAEGYLKNAVGPMRGYFREMAGDPDDLNWLNYEHISGQWDDWRDRFVAHYATDDENREYLTAEINLLLDGPAEYSEPLDALPPPLTPSKLPDGVTYEDGELKIKVGEKERFMPLVFQKWDNDVRARGKLRQKQLKALTSKESQSEEDLKKGEAISKEIRQLLKFLTALTRIYQRNKSLSYREKLAASLMGDKDRVTNVNEGEKAAGEGEKDSVDYKRLGEIDVYKERLARYEERLAAAETQFQHDHLKHDWHEIQQMRAELVTPVKALDSELKTAANKLLNEEQINMAPLSEPSTPVSRSDWLTIWALIILGLMLIFGCASRLVALMGAGMLMSFYMVMPPWPGVPEVPGPEHSYIINKNFIEAVALLVIASLPTGSWFGVDAMFKRLFGKWMQKKEERKAAEAANATAMAKPGENKTPDEKVTGEKAAEEKATT